MRGVQVEDAEAEGHDHQRLQGREGAEGDPVASEDVRLAERRVLVCLYVLSRWARAGVSARETEHWVLD